MTTFSNTRTLPLHKRPIHTVDVSPITLEIENYERNQDFDYLKVVTWNVNIEAHSAYASNKWINSNNKWDLVYQQCQQQDPDIISYQEIPISFSNVNHKGAIHPLIQKYINTNNWYITSSRPSHCGHTINLIHKRLEKNGYKIDVSDDIDPQRKWPAFILYKSMCKENKEVITQDEKSNERNDSDIDKAGYEYEEENVIEGTPDCKKILFFGTHLYYGQGNAARRRRAFDRLHNIALNKNMEEYVVICGDTNMRENEEDQIVKEYNGTISCCWQNIPFEIKNNSMFTCYKSYFQCYKPGVSRYDKIFYGRKIQCIELSVFDQPVSNNKHHFLSDHRAVAAILEIQ